MSAAGWIILVVVVAIVVAVAVALAARARKRQALQQRFGPEYERVVSEEGDRRAGERRLAGVAKVRDSLDIRELTDSERAAFADRWQSIQAEFVDQPAVAAGHADELIGEVMRTRGYPEGNSESRAELLSADHPDVMAQYREAEELREANTSAGDTPGSDTEALRGAVVRYRALFEELVGLGSKAAGSTTEADADADSETAPENATVRGSEASPETGPETVPEDDPTMTRAISADEVEAARHPHGHEPTVRGEAAVPAARASSDSAR